MISDEPTTAGSQHTDVVEAARAYIAEARRVAGDGLTWSEFGVLLVGLLRLSISVVDVLQLPGSVKKQAVLEAAAALFDALADRAVPIWAYPVWVAVRGPVRSIVLAIASGAVDQLVPLVRAQP